MSNTNREIAWKKYAENRKRIRKAVSELSMAYSEQTKILNGSIFYYQTSTSRYSKLNEAMN